MSVIDSFNLRFLEKFLDLSLERHTAISSNIANLNTPGYKRKIVKFEDELKKVIDNQGEGELVKTHPRHLPTQTSIEDISAEVEISSAPPRADGNNVRLEQEMVELSKNNIKYNLGIQAINKIFKEIRDAIREGK